MTLQSYFHKEYINFMGFSRIYIMILGNKNVQCLMNDLIFNEIEHLYEIHIVVLNLECKVFSAISHIFLGVIYVSKCNLIQFSKMISKLFIKIKLRLCLFLFIIKIFLLFITIEWYF